MHRGGLAADVWAVTQQEGVEAREDVEGDMGVAKPGVRPAQPTADSESLALAPCYHIYAAE